MSNGTVDLLISMYEPEDIEYLWVNGFLRRLCFRAWNWIAERYVWPRIEELLAPPIEQEIEVDWHYEEPEPSVGWDGGLEIEFIRVEGERLKSDPPQKLYDKIFNLLENELKSEYDPY